MQESQQTQTGLPAPKWCFVILGVPTFYMPLAYLSVVVWAVLGILLTGEVGDPPEWMMHAIQPSLYVTLGMWPIYIAWVSMSKRLAWREKGWWLFNVVFLNMIGMPMFYVFMIRRYLGLKQHMGERDDAALDRFLIRHEVCRDWLSSDQLTVLRFYCRRRRLAKWGIVPMIAFASLMLYTAVVFVPKSGVRLFANVAPTRVVIVDSAIDSKKEIAPDPETLKLHVQIVMMFGASAGVLGVMSIFILVQTMSDLWGNWHRKALIDLLKATDRGI